MLHRMRRWLGDIRRGMHGSGLRAQLRPARMIYLAETLRDGDAAAISHLFQEVAGEALSLTAGASLQGGEAVKALSDAHAAVVVTLRESISPFPESTVAPPYLGAQHLLAANRQILLDWIQTGHIPQNGGGAASEMAQIAQHFLNRKPLRRSAASVFLSANEVMHAGLSMFTS